jgi:hypothetical protein
MAQGELLDFAPILMVVGKALPSQGSVTFEIMSTLSLHKIDRFSRLQVPPFCSIREKILRNYDTSLLALPVGGS